MYELIEKIIHKAKEEKVDISVAYDMLVSENDIDEDLKKAYDFLTKNYYEIHQMRKMDMIAELKIVCDRAENSDFVKKYLIALYDEGVLK